MVSIQALTSDASFMQCLEKSKIVYAHMIIINATMIHHNNIVKCTAYAHHNMITTCCGYPCSIRRKGSICL